MSQTAPETIARVPDSIGAPHTETRDAGPDAASELSGLRSANVELRAEIDRLRTEISLESQKARLLVPFSNKVFWFLVAYIGGVALILILDGASSFALDVSVLQILSGSTAVSVIGLISIILTGLFKSG